MKRFFKLGNFGGSNSSKKKGTAISGTENEKPVPLSRLSSLSDSSSGWGSIANFNVENEKYYRNESFNAKEFTKLHQACWLGNMEKVKKHIKLIAIDQVDHLNRTPLHLACAQAHKDIVLFLINSKANLDEQDSQGNTPLSVAILHRHQDICNILLDKGAKPNECNLEGDTALHLACKNGLQDVIVSLVSKRVDIDAINKVCSTPLYVATSQRQLEIVKLLLRLGANVNTPCQHQKTCLMVACEEGFEEMVQLFLYQQANVSAVNAEGFTAEDLARSADNYECVELLQKFATSFQADSSRTNFHIESSQIDGPTTTADTQDIVKEKESDSDSWNDDYSDDLPASQPKKIFSPIKLPILEPDLQIFADKSMQLNLETESIKNIKIKSENKHISESSSEILLKSSEMVMPLEKEPETEQTVPKIQSTESKFDDRDLLSELGLSDVSEPSSSIRNSFASKNIDLPDEKKFETSLKEMQVNDSIPANSKNESEVDPQLSYVDTDEESILEEDDKGMFGPREEGTLGRIDTMHHVDEVWEKNPVVLLSDSPSPEAEAHLYYARLAVIDSKASTMERDDTKDSENLKAEEAQVTEFDGEVLWDEMMQLLFEKLNEDNDESSLSGSCLIADEECKESSAKDLTFQEISSADEQSNISTCEDRPYIILSEILRDTAHNEKILDLFQRLRVAWMKEHARCRSFKQTIGVLKTQSSRVKPKLKVLQSERLESENKLNKVEFELESLKHVLRDEESKRRDLEFHLEKSKEQIAKLENNYLQEVNLRQTAQVALKSSQEELRSTNEFFDELKNEKPAKDEIEDKCTQTIDEVDANFKDKLSDLMEEKKNLSNKFDLEERSRLKYEAENVSLVNKLSELEAKFKSELSEKDSQIRNMQMISNTIENKETEVLTLHNKLQLIENEKLHLNSKFQSLQEKHELLLTEKETEKRSEDQSLHSINQQLITLKAAFDTLQAEYNSCKIDLEKTIEQNKTLESGKTSDVNAAFDSKEELRKLSDDNESLQNKLNIEKKSSLQFSEEKKDLESRLNNLQDLLQKQILIEDQLRKNLKMLSSTNETIKIKDKEIEELNKTMLLMEEEKLVLKKELKVNKEMHEKLKYEIKTLQLNDEQLVNMLRQQITSLQDRFNYLQITYNSCQSDLENATKQNKIYEESQSAMKLQWETTCESMQKKYQELCKEMMETRENALHGQTKLMAEVNEIQIEKSRLESELGSIRKQNVRISEILSVTENTLQETKLANFATENSLKSLQRDHQFLSQQNKRLMDVEKSFQDEIYYSKAEIQRLQIKNDQLSSQVATKTKSTDNANSDLEKFKLENEKLEKDRHLYLDKNKELSAQLENLKVEFEDEQTQTSNKYKMAEEELKKVQGELSATEAQVQYLNRKLELLEENHKSKDSFISNKSPFLKKSEYQFRNSGSYNQSQAVEDPIYEKEHDQEINSINKLHNTMQAMIQEMRLERKKNETTENPNFGANNGSGSDFVRKSDLEMIKRNYETQYFVELNRKLEQINVFLQGQSNATGLLEQIHRRHQNEYEAVIQTLQRDIGKYQRSSLEKDKRNNDLEEQYEHLKQLIKIKKRIKKKLVNETIPHNSQCYQMEDLTLFRTNHLSHFDEYKTTDPLKTWVKINL